jgi:glycosyltransferase involved in cell wall biosynthesis
MGKIPPDWIRTAASYPVPDAHFVIAGEGALRPVLEQEVRELGLGARFTLPGYVSREEVPALLTSFDVFWTNALQGFGFGLAYTPMTVLAFATLPAHPGPDRFSPENT